MMRMTRMMKRIRGDLSFLFLSLSFLCLYWDLGENDVEVQDHQTRSLCWFSFFILLLHLGEGHSRFDRLHLEPYHTTVPGFPFDESSRAVEQLDLSFLR